MINTAWLDSHDWMLRSSNNGISYDGFKRKRLGAWNTAPDWNERPECGGGFHGMGQEAHGFGFSYADLELHETRGPRVPIDGNKLKVPQMRLVASGADIPAEAFRRCGYLVPTHGQTISPRNGEVWIVVRGYVRVENQSGGCVGGYGNCRIASSNQSGGWVRGYGNCRITSSNQRGGGVGGYDDCRITSQNQRGGYVEGFGNCRITSLNQRGGWVRGYGNCRIKRDTDQKGD